MNALAKYAIAAAALVVVAIVGLTLRSTSGPGQVGLVPPSPNASPSPWMAPSPSVAPSGSPAPIAPTGGTIDPGRYRWTSPGGDVTFVLPDGWTGTARGIVMNQGTPKQYELAHYMPGSPNQVTHVYADACKSEGRLVPIDAYGRGLRGTLEDQVGTEADNRFFGGDLDFAGPLGRVSDPPTIGEQVEIREERGLDRSTCRYGSNGPLQIWANPAETTFFALAPGHRGIVYILEVKDGKAGPQFVFTGDLGPDATSADADDVSTIVGSFEISSR